MLVFLNKIYKYNQNDYNVAGNLVNETNKPVIVCPTPNIRATHQLIVHPRETNTPENAALYNRGGQHTAACHIRSQSENV